MTDKRFTFFVIFVSQCKKHKTPNFICKENIKSKFILRIMHEFCASFSFELKVFL